MSKFKYISASKSFNIETARVVATRSHYVEEKFDGSRFGFELQDASWQVLSRYGVNRAANIPYILEDLASYDIPDGTVLDGEVVVLTEGRRKCWELTRSVMGTKVHNAATPEAIVIFYDIQFLAGKDLRALSYLQRRKLLKKLLLNDAVALATEPTYVLASKYIGISRAFSIASLNKLWKLIVEEGGGEGVMLKHATKSNYGKDWFKVKKEYEIDVFVIGATPGKGKYSGLIGALETATMTNDGNIWPVGKLSSLGDDANRIRATELALNNELKFSVLTLRCNEVTKNLKFRHGRFLRWRDDKKFEDCSLSQLKEIADVV